MSLASFKVTVQLATTVFPGRWLCLDALLDAVLMLEGVREEDRILPLAAHDGRASIAPGKEALDRVNASEATYMASAAMFDTNFADRRGFVRSLHRDLGGETLPVTTDTGKVAKKVETHRGPAVSVLNNRIMMMPSLVVWLGHGDVAEVSELFSRLPGIGAKTTSGFGQIAELDIEEVDEHPMTGIVDSTSGELLRPIPEAVAARIPVELKNSRTRMETTRPPYFMSQNAIIARTPVGRAMDGIL